jgi:uncharacterized iron-regulated membrane protein
MNAWGKWWKRPQSVRLRKALFQVHLWAGIGLGLYILLMSVTGSALIFRRELTEEPRVAVPPAPNQRMSEGQLRQAVQRLYPGYPIKEVRFRRRPDQAAEVRLARPGGEFGRLFNPYTGADLGDSVRRFLPYILWLADMHDNLFLRRDPGHRLNAAGGVFTLLLILTGAIIWWPGVANWRRSLGFRWSTKPKAFNWTLHSALGFWTFAFFLMWAITGVYLSIPEPFHNAVDFLEPQKGNGRTLRFGDNLLFWLAQAHFGRFGGVGVKITWTVIGLAPAALFVTGAVMWWNRVLKPWLVRNKIRESKVRALGVPRAENSMEAQS